MKLFRLLAKSRFSSHKRIRIGMGITAGTLFCFPLFSFGSSVVKTPLNTAPEEEVPVSEHSTTAYPQEVNANITFAPTVPPPINRDYPLHLLVDMDVIVCFFLSIHFSLFILSGERRRNR